MGNQQVKYFFTYKSAVEGHEYDYNPNYNQDNLHSDYTGFYVGIGIVTAFAIVLLILNCFMSWCLPWRKYWNNHNTGNRLLLPVFITPPKNQEPLHF